MIGYNEVRILQPESNYVFSYAVCLRDPVSEPSFPISPIWIAGSSRRRW
jgi:hypothetical protein